MNRYLYRFGFESPEQRTANQVHGWDDEDSYAFFVEANSADEALSWAREVSEAFQHFLYRISGWSGPLPSWKADGYAHWIEDDPEILASAEDWAPIVRIEEMPDFSKWPDLL